MRRFVLNKLVRDKIYGSMLELGQKPQRKVLGGKKFLGALKAKLVEEVNELELGSPKAVEELSDLLEVIEQIGKELGSDFKKIRSAQLAKRRKVGGFSKKIFVSELEVKNGDPWGDYYATEPERFPEVKKRSKEKRVPHEGL